MRRLEQLRALVRHIKLAANPANPGQAGHDWSSAIALPSSDAVYDNLPPIADIPHDMPWVSLDHGTLERDLASYIGEDPYPIPTPADREGYHGARHYDYWLSGLKDYLLLKQSLHALGVTNLEENASVFELGCASGRVLRHLLCHEPGIDLWGADLNLRHVEWIRRFLAPSVRVF